MTAHKEPLPDSPSPNALAAYWMPFTANRDFKSAPRMLHAAQDMHYETNDGRKILDGTSGLWCCNAGHCRRPIVEAIQNQAGHLDYAPPFQFATHQSFELANRLALLAPGELDHVFFTNSGSEAVDTALKIALGYHKVTGQGARQRLIGRERGYHGVGFGGVSVGGIGPNRAMFTPLLNGVDHLPATYNFDEQAFSRGEPEWGAHLANALENLVTLHGAETIAAVIVEPMAGSTGVLPPPRGYLQRLREITRHHGILLIFDEVITGFGRLGYGFAAERYGVEPDMITFAKGLTSGTVPMGGVMVSKTIYDSFMQGPELKPELMHGYTYSSHPLATAAALATLDLYKNEGLFQRALDLEEYWADAVHSLKFAPYVKDIRTIGLTAGIDLVSIDGQVGARAYKLMDHAFHQQDILVRVTADTLALSPPLIITQAQIDECIEKVKLSLEAIE